MAGEECCCANLSGVSRQVVAPNCEVFIQANEVNFNDLDPGLTGLMSLEWTLS